MGKGGIGSSSGQLIQSIRVQGASPRRPRNFTATVNVGDSEVIDLAWVDGADITPELPVIGYRIERKTTGSFAFLVDILSATTLTFADRTLVSDTYTYRIRSFIANPAPASLWAGNEPSATSIVFAGNLAMTTSGLLFRDDFDRANSTTVGNGWSEVEDQGPATIQILTNRCEGGTSIGNGDVRRRQTGLPATVIMQSNQAENGNGVNGNVAVRSNQELVGLGSYDAYLLQYIKAVQSLIRIVKVTGGAGVVEATKNIAISATQARGTRIILEESGANTIVRVYMTAEFVDQSTITEEFVLQLTFTDTSPIATDADHDQITLHVKSTAHHDEQMCMGADVVCTGLPTGHKVEIDSRGKVTEVGGTVTIDMNTFATPFTDFKLYDAADVLLDTITPAGGYFGGAIFVAS